MRNVAFSWSFQAGQKHEAAPDILPYTTLPRLEPTPCWCLHTYCIQVDLRDEPTWAVTSSQQASQSPEPNEPEAYGQVNASTPKMGALLTRAVRVRPRLVVLELKRKQRLHGADVCTCAAMLCKESADPRSEMQPPVCDEKVET